MRFAKLWEARPTALVDDTCCNLTQATRPLRNRLSLPKAKEARRSRTLDVARDRQAGYAPDWLTASHWNKHRL
ncbi:hypothetical protein FocTR4_00010607 [Fusarium oxysporum f. sp. cubense]|uniref:Uncharacterized protein n=1 Tax=Fusarium oxysporum f. sp. cubense TaxID=61366 RepID=A0A5C6T819_FUSOC|nr:hypothetical protein FocTR4_00010607 [Fusarium oxysporum f. sp. cubense]